MYIKSITVYFHQVHYKNVFSSINFSNNMHIIILVFVLCLHYVQHISNSVKVVPCKVLFNLYYLTLST